MVQYIIKLFRQVTTPLCEARTKQSTLMDDRDVKEKIKTNYKRRAESQTDERTWRVRQLYTVEIWI